MHYEIDTRNAKKTASGGYTNSTTLMTRNQCWEKIHYSNFKSSHCGLTLMRLESLMSMA